MAFQFEEDLSCPICHDLFENPVVLSCSHSFCDGCIKLWWRNKIRYDCPVCKSTPATRHPPCNLALKNMCKTLRERRKRISARSEDLCRLHYEKFKLFCLDDRQPVCVVCRDSKTHLDHKFRPVDELAQERKERIQNLLVPIKAKLNVFKQVKGKCDQTADHIKVQAQQAEEQIKEQFKKLHQIIHKDEEARITALRREEKQKSMRMQRNDEALSREISALSDTIEATEKELRAEDVLFLRKYEAVVERVRQCPLLDDPQLVSGALIEVAKHLGNLTYPILNKLKEMESRTPVTLDPNTAHPHLILSNDLTSVRYGKRQKLPENPERIDYYRCVLGSEGFISGTHSWDVEVGNNDHWLLGVAAESAHKRRDIRSGLWLIRFWYDEYSAMSPPNKVTTLKMKKSFKKIRVSLDCKRALTFSDPDTNTHICTFTHIPTQKLFPYFSNGKKVPLKILPVTASAQTPSVIIFIIIFIVIVLLLIVMIYIYNTQCNPPRRQCSNYFW